MLRYMENQSTDATAEIFSGLVDFHKKDKKILQKKNPFAYPSSNIITALKDTILSIYSGGAWRTFVVDTDTDLGAGNLDTGAGFAVGTDYYVYLVDDGNNGLLVISANSSYPAGQNADNSRKIGGFHYGHVRCTNDRFVPVSPNGTVFGADGAGWRQNVLAGSIVPNSVWDLHNRPLCSPEGMALVGNVWVDIYPSSVAEAISFETGADGMAFVAGGKLQSRYGLAPATGADGLNWYSFNELAARSGKRLLTYGEWIRAAYGNPGGQDNANDYGWTSQSNETYTRVGCQANGSGAFDAQSAAKRFAVSAHNLCDCVGNVFEWIDELSAGSEDTASSGTHDWRYALGEDKGGLYAVTLAALACGGLWACGVYSGPRTVSIAVNPTDTTIYTGARLACDRLAG